jgi:glutamine synthetase
MATEARLSTEVAAKYAALPLPKGVIQLEYVWRGGLSALDVRSKSRTWTKDEAPKCVSELPIWNYDGSSTGQAPGHDSEVLLKPVRLFPDPFRGLPHLLVLCETMLPDGSPHPGDTRHDAEAAFNKALDEKPWFGLEQEYTLFQLDKVTPLGWPKGGFPGPQGPYYCSAGADVAFGRPVVEAHYKACLYAGIKMSGINAEVLPGQWEYQVGPCEGIESGDHAWMARYIMFRVCEDFGVAVSFEPKPIPGDWNGSGMHTNYSTAAMRADGGYKVIIEAIEKLGKRHGEHIAVYGEGNEKRLTGKHETASYKTFLYGVANRGASIRIPRDAERDGKGYFEDRRPASNCDPWTVTSKIFKTTILEA